MKVGFLGLGVMGQPMALNLAAAGVDLVVWNRTPDKTAPLRAAGADVADTVDDVFAGTDVVLMMLANGAVIDDVLGRGTGDRDHFRSRVQGHLVVHMGTTPADYSAGLGRDVTAAGGTYVEAPVSGSRGPAVAGQLVVMLAGSDAEVERVRPIIAPVGRQTVACGPVPNATNMKLAANLFLITLVTGLAEAVTFAQLQGLDLDVFREVVDGGQMASTVSRAKTAKLAAADFTVQAGLSDVLYNNKLVADAARTIGAATPLLDQARTLFAEAEAQGHGALDMIGVIHALAARSGAEHRWGPQASFDDPSS